MDDKQRTILRNVRLALVKDMEPEAVLLQMSASQVFSDRDEEEIKAKNTRERQCVELLSKLARRGAKAYDIFIEALEEVHSHLANVINDAGKWL